MDQSKQSGENIPLFPSAFYGIVSNLVGSWIAAYIIDAPALAENPHGGPGAFFLWMCFCIPASLGVGPVAAILGGYLLRYLGKRAFADFKYEGLWALLGASIAGFLSGVLPFVILVLMFANSS